MKRHRGSTLVSALFILLALLIIGVSTAHTALDAERSARAERDRQIALQAAEAALVDAERDIEGGREPARAAFFAKESAQGFVPGCGRSGEVNAGLCAASPQAAWVEVDLSENGKEARTVEYGAWTGAQLPVGQGSLPARLPRYLIELMPYAQAGADASARTGNFYRITALGVGSRAETQVVLQTFYLKPAVEAP